MSCSRVCSRSSALAFKVAGKGLTSAFTRSRTDWRSCASLLPPWLAPNTVTLIGFSAIALNFLTVAIFNPDLVGPAGSWLYLSCAAGLFFYQTFDAIDGKQARATGTSSPLGEVVDHGFDTLNCEFTSAIIQLRLRLIYGSQVHSED